MTRRLLSVGSLEQAEIPSLLARAAELRTGAATVAASRQLGLLFFEASLRTRTGFHAAAQRLGWPAPIEVLERRSSEVSMPESEGDTVAVLAAYVDAVVLRAHRPIEELASHVPADVGLLNAGDRGPTAEHPTQALIDVFAMEQLVGPLDALRVVLCGDLRMRAARSLLALFVGCPPGELLLVTDPALRDGLELPDGLNHLMTDTWQDLSDVDALHAVGIPHGAVGEAVRTRLRVDRASLACLSARGRVFSPMPVIDEIAKAVRDDDRMAYLEQSALGLAVRMAVLESISSDAVTVAQRVSPT